MTNQTNEEIIEEMEKDYKQSKPTKPIKIIWFCADWMRNVARAKDKEIERLQAIVFGKSTIISNQQEQLKKLNL